MLTKWKMKRMMEISRKTRKISSYWLKRLILRTKPKRWERMLSSSALKEWTLIKLIDLVLKNNKKSEISSWKSSIPRICQNQLSKISMQYCSQILSSRDLLQKRQMVFHKTRTFLRSKDIKARLKIQLQLVVAVLSTIPLALNASIIL